MTSAFNPKYFCPTCNQWFHYKLNYNKHSCKAEEVKLKALMKAVKRVESNLAKAKKIAQIAQEAKLKHFMGKDENDSK